MKHLLLCAFVALTCTACSESTETIEAALQGTVYEVGGQNINLAGVEVTLVETGEMAMTDANGGFDFAGLDEGSYTLGFGAPVAGLHHEDGEDGDDDGDIEENEIEIEITKDGGDVEIRVAIENDGRVKDFSHGDHEDRHAARELRRPELSEHRVEGYIKLSDTEHGQRFKVAVYGLEAGDMVDIFVGDDLLGTPTADEEGNLCFVREDLDLSNLAGRVLNIYLNDSEDKILFGEIPALPEEKDDDDGEEGEEEDDKKDEEEDGGDEEPK